VLSCAAALLLAWARLHVAVLIVPVLALFAVAMMLLTCTMRGLSLWPRLSDSGPSPDCRSAACRPWLQRGCPLIVVATYQRPVDPDLDDLETPDDELRARAERTARRALCRVTRGPSISADLIHDAHVPVVIGSPGWPNRGATRR
jgi:hypothetical protein